MENNLTKIRNYGTSDVKTDYKHRYFMFDIIRIVCALVIFGRQAQTMAGFSFGIVINNICINMTSIIMTCFFMLSGFSLYISNGVGNLFNKDNLCKFYKKRAISILPIYYLTHFVWIFFYEEDLIKGIIATPLELLGIQSVFSTVFGVLHNGGTWFISCIIISYFVYPLMQEIINKLSMKDRAIILLISLLLAAYMPYYAVLSGSMTLYTNPFMRVIEFFIGVVLASLINNNDKKTENNFSSNIKSLCIVILCGLFLLAIFYKNIYKLQSFAIFALALILYYSAKIRCRCLERSVILRYASALTYSFYIFQIFIWTPSLEIIEFLEIGNNKFDFLVAMLLLIIVCVCVHELYEKPIQKILKTKWLDTINT